jgi:hypothetical protein
MNSAFCTLNSALSVNSNEGSLFMKQKISGPVAIGVIVVVSALILAGLCRNFFYEKKFTPEETRANMQKGQEQMRQRYGR